MKTVFILLDHGLAHACFFETELAHLLSQRGLRLVFLVPGNMVGLLRRKYPGRNYVFESMREKEITAYRRTHWEGLQELYEYLRRVGMSARGPLSYVNTVKRRKEHEARGRRRLQLLLLNPLVGLMRRSRAVRMAFRRFFQNMFSPSLYADLFEKYRPALVVSNMAGWRMDQYLLREANHRGVRTAVVIIGWDNPTSQGLPGAWMDHANVWSRIQVDELAACADWDPAAIHIGGMPLFDSYIDRRWVMPRREYFRLHGLDPRKRLIAFAATGLNFSPNSHLIGILAELVGQGALGQPAQLLVRLHPNHFKPVPRYQHEARAIRLLAERHPDLHIVEPREMPGELERYAGEDYPEKASMLAHADVLVSLYSTMVVEAAIHDLPVVNACIDTSAGWGEDFWVPLHEVATFPTSVRVNGTGAGRLARSTEELGKTLRAYLQDRTLDAPARRRFLEQELTFIDGQATARTADFIAGLAGRKE